MKNKNRFERVKEQGYIIKVAGHTTFPEDICRMLDRLDYLEKERLKRSDNSDYAKLKQKDIKMDKNELKSELAENYYSEDANCLSDFIDILDEYEKLTSHNIDYVKLLDNMEKFALDCDYAGNQKDAKRVRSWVKKLSH